jgi:hypothetical protein
MTIIVMAAQATPGTITSKHDTSQRRGVPERPARKAPQNTFLSGKSPRKRADGAKRIAADPHTLPDNINNLFF